MLYKCCKSLSWGSVQLNHRHPRFSLNWARKARVVHASCVWSQAEPSNAAVQAAELKPQVSLPLFIWGPSHFSHLSYQNVNLIERVWEWGWEGPTEITEKHSAAPQVSLVVGCGCDISPVPSGEWGVECSALPSPLPPPMELRGSLLPVLEAPFLPWLPAPDSKHFAVVGTSTRQLFTSPHHETSFQWSWLHLLASENLNSTTIHLNFDLPCRIFNC